MGLFDFLGDLLGVGDSLNTANNTLQAGEELYNTGRRIFRGEHGNLVDQAEAMMKSIRPWEDNQQVYINIINMLEAVDDNDRDWVKAGAWYYRGACYQLLGYKNESRQCFSMLRSIDAGSSLNGSRIEGWQHLSYANSAGDIISGIASLFSGNSNNQQSYSQQSYSQQNYESRDSSYQGVASGDKYKYDNNVMAADAILTEWRDSGWDQNFDEDKINNAIQYLSPIGKSDADYIQAGAYTDLAMISFLRGYDSGIVLKYINDCLSIKVNENTENAEYILTDQDIVKDLLRMLNEED